MMSFKLFTLITLSTVLSLGSGTPAYADSGPSASTPGAGDKVAEDNCYADLLKKCQKLGIASSTALNTGVEVAKSLPGSSERAKASGSAQTTAATQLEKDAASCQTMAKECKTVCRQVAKQKPDIVKTCEKDMGDVATMYTTNGKGLTESGMQTSSIANMTAAGDPKAESTNAAGTTKGDQTAAPKGKGGGLGDMSSMMPLAMMGAMMAMQSKDKDEIPTLPPNGALQANGTIDCSKADAGMYSDCNTYLTAACQSAMVSGAFGSSPTCGAFSTRYCGVGQSNTYATPYVAGLPTTTANGAPTTLPTMGLSGEGQASPYCQTVMAYGYCQTPGRAGCPSCQNLGTVGSAGCQANPAACIGQSSNEIIAQARTTCPDDPIFSNPALVAPAMAAGAPAVAGSLAVGAPGVVSGGVPILPQSVGGMQAASFDTEGPTSDIAGRFSPSVFSTGTQAIRTRCQSKQLNNCP